MSLYFDIAAVILASLAVYKAFRAQRYDERLARAASSKGDADAAASYEELADRAASRAIKLQDQIDELRSQDDVQQKEIDDLKADSREKDCLIEDLREWAERLVHQVISLGGKPVELRMRQPSTNCEDVKP